MIRTATTEGWWLITHPDHARLAGALADAWGNDDFAPPEPYLPIREAVYCHDDGWRERDAVPQLTREGKPSAFSSQLVGTYAAFEEIDLADYLAVRGAALEAVATRDPYAAIVVSMHTVNLLTEQADLSTIAPGDRPLHEAFVAGQRRRQAELAEQLRAGDPVLGPLTDAATLERAFRFLQCCDSFSLLACSRFGEERALRHAQPKRDGGEATILCRPLGAGHYELDPWPLVAPTLRLEVPARFIRGQTFTDPELFRAAWAAAEVEPMTIRLSRAGG